MSDDPHHKPYDDHKKPYVSPFDARISRVRKRQNKIVDEIMANRRGEFTVPTWVMTAALVAILLAIVAFLIFG